MNENIQHRENIVEVPMVRINIVSINKNMAVVNIEKDNKKVICKLYLGEGDTVDIDSSIICIDTPLPNHN